MTTAEALEELVKQELSPYIKPRQKVEHVRKVLAVHIQEAIQGPEIEVPISLVDESSKVTIPLDATGPYKEYLEALDANLKAVLHFQRIKSQVSETPPIEKPEQKTEFSIIQNQIRLIKLKQKEQRLEVLNRYLDELGSKPEAQPGYLQLSEMFRNSPVLPKVPEDIINGVTETQHLGAGNGDVVKEYTVKLEKEILKQKLLLRKEEKLLEAARCLAPVNPESISEARKRCALNATRNELIAWIETELGKVSGGSDPGHRRRTSGSHEATTMDKVEGMVQEVKEKYAEYISRRRKLVKSIGKTPIFNKVPEVNLGETSDKTLPPLEPMIHLLTPYLEQLFEISRQQKAIMASKAHLTSYMTNQRHEIRELLERLAEDSELLRMYPMPNDGNLDDNFNDDLTRISEWTFAAEAAKISSLEAIAEKIENSQMALDSAQKALEDIDKLLNPSGQGNNEGVEGDATVTDIWMNTTKSPGRKLEGEEKRGMDDDWLQIHGKLGLIGQDI